jgi:undecaprenyl-diphosphatase
MRMVTLLGSSAVLVALALAVGAWFWWRRGRPGATALLLAAYGGSDLLGQAVRALTARTRPPPVLAVGHFVGHAFPSGHATEATAVYGMLAVVVASGTRRWRGKVAAWAAAVLTATLVGISRLYLGAHWLTDVLAGWALGSAWLLLVVAVAQTLAALRPLAPRRNRLLR